MKLIDLPLPGPKLISSSPAHQCWPGPNDLVFELKKKKTGKEHQNVSSHDRTIVEKQRIQHFLYKLSIKGKHEKQLHSFHLSKNCTHVVFKRSEAPQTRSEQVVLKQPDSSVQPH